MANGVNAESDVLKEGVTQPKGLRILGEAQEWTFKASAPDVDIKDTVVLDKQRDGDWYQNKRRD